MLERSRVPTFFFLISRFFPFQNVEYIYIYNIYIYSSSSISSSSSSSSIPACINYLSSVVATQLG